MAFRFTQLSIAIFDHISQVTVLMHLRCGGMFTCCFTSNSLPSLLVKEFESLSASQLCQVLSDFQRQQYSGILFLDTV